VTVTLFRYSSTLGSRLYGLLLVAPLLILFGFFFIAPLAQSFITSFHTQSPSGAISDVWTLANYKALGNRYYIGILVRTLRIGAEVTIIAAILAYPVAIFIAGSSRTWQTILTFLYVAPWFVNVAVKALGWTFLLSPHGIVNEVLRSLGLIEVPLRLMNNETGVIIGLTHASLVLVVLPLTAAIQAIEPALIAAAGNLGARGWQVFCLVIFPLTIPALAVGVAITFLLAITAYATPTLLGGVSTPMMAYLTFQVNLVRLDWPLGSAMAVAFLAVTLSVLGVLHLVVRRATKWAAA
jgi:putative spermidine/putrescine transport system permease protein